MECRLAVETEVPGENLPQRHFCPPQIPHDSTRVWTRAAAVGSQRLTAWVMARPYIHVTVTDLDCWATEISFFCTFQLKTEAFSFRKTLCSFRKLNDCIKGQKPASSKCGKKKWFSVSTFKKNECLITYTYLLTYVRRWDLPEKLPIVQPFRKLPAILKEPEGSSPCSQDHTTSPYPEPVRSSPYHPILPL
jgi:hypothetical protein